MGSVIVKGDEEGGSTSSATVAPSPERGGASDSFIAKSCGEPTLPAGQSGAAPVMLSTPPHPARKPLSEVKDDVTAELLQFSQDAIRAAIDLTAPEQRRQFGIEIIAETTATVWAVAPEDFVEGAAVSIWSTTTKKWFDDGIVENVGPDGVKVIYDGARAAQVLEMDKLQDNLKFRDEVPAPGVAVAARSAASIWTKPAPQSAGGVQATPPRRQPATLTRDSPRTRGRESPMLLSGRTPGQGPGRDSTGATMSPREVSSVISPDRCHHGESEPRDVQHEVLECMQVAGSLAVSLSRKRPDLRQMQHDALECRRQLGGLMPDQQCFARLLEHVEQLLASTEETAFGASVASGSTNTVTGAARSSSATAQGVMDFVASGRLTGGPPLARSFTPRVQQRSEAASLIQPSHAPPSVARAPGLAKSSPRDAIAQPPTSARATWPPKRSVPPGPQNVGVQPSPALGPHQVYMPSNHVLARSQTMSYTSLAAVPTSTIPWQRPIVAATSASINATTSAKDIVRNPRLEVPTEPLAAPPGQRACSAAARSSSSRSPGPGPRAGALPMLGPASSWGLVTPPEPWPPPTGVPGLGREPLATTRTLSPHDDGPRSRSQPPVVPPMALSVAAPRRQAVPPIGRMAELQASVGAFGQWHPESSPPSGPSEPPSARSTGGCSGTGRAPMAQSSPVLGHCVKRMHSAPSPAPSPLHAVGLAMATPSPRRGCGLAAMGPGPGSTCDPMDVSPSDLRLLSAIGADAATQTQTPTAPGPGPALG